MNSLSGWGEVAGLIAIGLAICVGVDSAYAIECNDPYFAEIEINQPRIGPMPGKDEETVVCLVTCYSNAEERKGTGSRITRDLYTHYVSPKLTAEQLQLALSNIRLVYQTRSVDSSSTEECMVSEMPVSEHLAAVLYADPPRYSDAEYEKLLVNALVLEDSKEIMDFGSNRQEEKFVPVISIHVEESRSGDYIERIILGEARNTGYQVANKRKGYHFLVDADFNISGEGNEGYGMEIVLVLSDAFGTSITSLVLPAETRVNGITPQSHENLARWAMAGKSEIVRDFLLKGKRFLNDRGGALYRVEANDQTRVSPKVMRSLLSSVPAAKIKTLSQDNTATVAHVYYPGNITSLSEVVEQKLELLYEMSGLSVPSIEVIENRIAID